MTSTQRWILFLIICVLFLLIGIAALLTVLGYFPASDAGFRQFAVAILFVDIAAAVVTAFRIMFAPARRIVVNLTISGKRPTQVTLDQGEFVAYNLQMKEVAKGSLRVTRGKIGWNAQFEVLAASVDHFRLTVTDSTGRDWHSKAIPLDELDATLN